MKLLNQLAGALALPLLTIFSLNAQASTVNNFASGPPYTDILCRNNPHPSLVQNCWTAGTNASHNFHVADTGNAVILGVNAFGSILGDLTLLYKAESFEDSTLNPPIRSAPAGEEGYLQNSYTTSFIFDILDTDDGYFGATISYDGGPAVDCSSECYLVIKDGNHNPAAFLFNLALGWDPSGRQPVDNGTPSWDGGIMDDLSLANFWRGGGGSISYLALYGNVAAVPVPAAFWLFGSALLGFIGLSRRSTRV